MIETTPQVETVSVTIDGQTIAVPKGSLLIEACRKLGVDVPFFCWHPHMTPFGACRQCLVKVEGMRKPVTSCTTQVTDGMVVYASTDEVKQWREGILGFILANHPLECPTCDKGGECDLQNNAFAHGPRHSLFREQKRHFQDYDMGPIVARDMDRCIQCKRCIRFGLEWSGDHGLEFFGRGAATSVGTFARGPYLSKFSGNVTEVCPVGALTSQMFRLTSRPWEMKATAAVCPHCAVGCNITTFTRQNELLRITARENVHVNVCWTCDKGKYGYHFVNSERRLKSPMFRRGERLVPASWREALDTVASRLREIKDSFGPKAIGFIGGAKCGNEDVFMFQRFAREAVGTANIDHRMGETLPASLIPGSGVPLDEIARARTIVLFAADIREEAPVVWLRVHNAQLSGAKLVVIDERGSEADGFADLTVRYRPNEERRLLEALTAAVSGGPVSAVDGVSQDDVTRIAALAREGCLILAGPRVARRPDSAEIVLALRAFGDALPNSRLGLVYQDNNTRGAYDMGAVPDYGPGWQRLSQPGLSTTQMLQAAADGKLQALYLMGADVVQNFPDAGLVKKALEAVPFLVVQDVVQSETSQQADVVLPALTFAERDVTFTNLEGRIQASYKSVEPVGGARPDWEILAALMAAMGVSPNVQTREDVLLQVTEAVPEYENAVPERMPEDGALQIDQRFDAPHTAPAAHAPAEGSAALPLILLTGNVLYDRGHLTQDTEAFAQLEPSGWIDIAGSDAAASGISDGDMVTVSSEFGVVTLPARVRDRVSPGTAFVPVKAAGFRANALTSVTRALQRVRVDKA